MVLGTKDLAPSMLSQVRRTAGYFVAVRTFLDHADTKPLNTSVFIMFLCRHGRHFGTLTVGKVGSRI